MISDDEISDLLVGQPSAADAEEMVDRIIKRLRSCPFCAGEIFIHKTDFLRHVEATHQDKFHSSGQEQIRRHKVEPDSKEILICSYCPFAVSKGHATYSTTVICDHVKHCSRKPNGGGIRFRVSQDKDLIDRYIRGGVLVELFRCPSLGCSQTFGSREATIQHLANHHSSTRKSDVGHDDIDCIRWLAQKILDKSKPQPQTPTVVVAPVEIHGISEPGIGTGIQTPLPPVVPVVPPTPTPGPVRGPTSVAKTLTTIEVRDGCLLFPLSLMGLFKNEKELKIQFPSDEEKDLRFDPFDNRLSGLGLWYRESAIEAGDIVHIRVLGSGEPKVQIWTEWEKNINHIFKTPADDLQWELLPIRDCLLKVFAELGGTAHYRMLYAEISKHRPLSFSSVVATLSKHRDILFVHTGQGKWKAIAQPVSTRPPEPRPRPAPLPGPLQEGPTERIRAIYAEIRAQDFVYELLYRLKEEQSFDQLCQKIAEGYDIDWRDLSTGELFDANDPRFKRLENGRWALADWFAEPIREPEPTHPPEPLEPPEPPQPEPIYPEPPDKQWFVREKNKSDVYGPATIQELEQWAEECCIGPDDEVSEDRKNWSPALDVPELKMVCFVRRKNGQLYGPVNPKAVEQLVADGELAPVTSIADLQSPPSESPPAVTKSESLLGKVWHFLLRMLRFGRH